MREESSVSSSSKKNNSSLVDENKSSWTPSEEPKQLKNNQSHADD